jgi:energy-coupling factor transport system ATP-binding protein
VDKLRAASLTVPQTIEVLYDLDQQDGEKLPIDALSIEECADILEQEYLN